jgi:ribosome-associated protein
VLNLSRLITAQVDDMSEDVIDEFEEFDEGPSKTQIKREMHALQELGKKVLELNKDQQQKLSLSDEMYTAIDEYHRIRSNEAKRRHLQYVGKVMRRQDDIEAIANRIALFDTTSDAYNRQFHQLEHWRDRLIAEGDKALNELIAEKPDTDRQTLRQLIRAAQKEQSQQKPPASSRKIFRKLREIFDM